MVYLEIMTRYTLLIQNLLSSKYEVAVFNIQKGDVTDITPLLVNI